MTSNAQAKLTYIEGTQEAIKTAIESKGVPVGEETTFRDYSEKIGMIATGTDISDADAIAADVVASKTFYATSGAKKTGTMTDRGTVSTDIVLKTTEVTITAGKHSGSGIVKISDSEQSNIIPDNIKSGVTILGETGSASVRDIADSNATALDVLGAKTFYSTTGGRKTGSMVDNGTITVDIASKATQVTIAAGKHSGSGIVKIAASEQAKIISGNIKSGVTILGVGGNPNVVDTSSGTAVAGEILSSKKAWVDGLEVTGSMVDRGTVSTNITQKSEEIGIAAGKHSGTGIIKIAAAEQAKIIEENIKAGVIILGVTGNLSGGTDVSDADAVEADVVSGKTFYAASDIIKIGTLADQGTISTDIITKDAEITIAAGRHSGSGRIKISAIEQAKFLAENIKSGVTLLGVAGNLIPTVPPGVTYRVRFFDYDGTLLKTQIVASGDDATAPSLPSHSNLTFQEWNNAFVDVTSDIDVGANYITTDGKSYLYLSVTPLTGFTLTIFIYKATADLMTITWGDGNTSTSYDLGNTSFTHVYAASGNYPVTISCSDVYCFGNPDNYDSILPTTAMQAMLTDVRVGNNVVYFKSFNFQNCSSLRTISIPIAVDSWTGTGAFTQCTSLECVVIPKTVSMIPDSAFSSCSRLSVVVLPEQLLTIGLSVFAACKNLRSIVLPYGLDAILATAFVSCQSLESIIIPNSVTVMDVQIFSSCNSLRTVVLSNSVAVVPGGCFEYCVSLQSVTIPENITELGSGLFSGCNSLSEIILPSTLEHIADYCFSFCYSLKYLNIPSGVGTIATNAFDSCELEYVILPPNLSTISDYMFLNNTKLKELVFGALLTYIGAGAFSSCTGIKEYTFNSLIPPELVDTTAFVQISPITKMYVPDASVAAYKAATSWDTFEDYIYPLSSKP
jgi:hypothetical protein